MNPPRPMPTSRLGSSGVRSVRSMRGILPEATKSQLIRTLATIASGVPIRLTRAKKRSNGPR
jgi:hypothetical protein